MIVSTTKYHPVFPPKFYPFYITSTNCIYSSKGLFASPFLQLQKRSPLYSPLLTQASVITVNTDLSRLLVNSIVSVCVRHDILSLYLLSILQCWKFLSSFFILQQKQVQRTPYKITTRVSFTDSVCVRLYFYSCHKHRHHHAWIHGIYATW